MSTVSAKQNTSPYRHAFKSALVQQGLILVLAAPILDGGDLLNVCLVAFIAFWIGVGLIRLRCNAAPTRLDLILIEGASLPLCVIAFFAVHFFWTLKGFQGLM